MKKAFLVTFEYPTGGWPFEGKEMDIQDVEDIVHDGSIEFGHFDDWTVSVSEGPA